MIDLKAAALGLAIAWAIHSPQALSDPGATIHPLALTGHHAPAASGADRDQESTPVAATSVVGNDAALVVKQRAALGLRGFVQTELAHTIADPERWSNMLVRAQLTAQGAFNEQVKWKLSGRLDYDAAYHLYDHFPPDVRRDQRLNFMLRENFLDVAAGDWDVRLGRQHVVWGEVVGLFFADVVSARDMRQFILPEFEILRIPQWAARAEYSKGDIHAELLWVPVASYDESGKPGAEFFPAPPPPPPGFATLFRSEVRPARNLSNTNYGLRLAMLHNGWDLSGFYYRSMDATPSFRRQVVAGPQPAFIYEARHDRIHQYGTTLGKAFGSVVLKGEAVYTRGRQFNVLRLADDDGVVRQDTVDWIVSVDFTLPRETRLNLQLFQRQTFDHDPDIIPERRENGASVLLAGKIADRLEGQMLWIASLNRTDWLLRPRLIWSFETNWRLAAGVDIFRGPPLGFFGRFANRDRVYTELRYSF
jgi:hypothetical protein